MQRSDLQPYIPLLNDLDDAERGMVIAGKNNKSLLMRLEECIDALSMQDKLHNNYNYKATQTFHCAASMLLTIAPIMIEAIIILTTLNMPNSVFFSKDDYNSYNFKHYYCHDRGGFHNPCLGAGCSAGGYPLDNFNEPWPYAYPSQGDHDSTLFACYSMYSDRIDDASIYRIIIIAATSCVNLIISSVLLLAMVCTTPSCQRLFSDRTTLAMLPKKIQDEINELATKTSTVIADSHNINEITQALRPALLDVRQRTRQRRAFLSGKSHPESPLYRFFQADIKDSNHNRLPGDGDHEITKIIFGYAGLLK